jgi:hypothetical protein
MLLERGQQQVRSTGRLAVWRCFSVWRPRARSSKSFGGRRQRQAALGDVPDDLLGLPESTGWGPFLTVTLDDGVRLDYAEPGIGFPGQHYALLVSDDVFDRALERIKADGVPFWADPGMRLPNEINTNHGVAASTSTIRPVTVSS